MSLEEDYVKKNSRKIGIESLVEFNYRRTCYENFKERCVDLV